MATYELFGRRVNTPEALARVTSRIAAPTECPFCGGGVSLASNARFYGGREFGWPLTYVCCQCEARVGCHPGTDIALGTLADKPTMIARKAAHKAFDPLWKGKAPGMRRKAYVALAKALGKSEAHISWMDQRECALVVRLVIEGRITVPASQA